MDERKRETIRMGVVGVRHFHVFETLRTFGRREDVEVVGVAESDRERRERLLRDHPLPCFESLDAMLDGARPDAVALHNLPSERADTICRCAERGIHVWTDKPVALDRDQLERVRAALADGRIAFSMNVAGGYSPVAHGLREKIRSGGIGDLVQFVDAGQHGLKLPAAAAWERLPWELDASQSGGLIVQMAIHAISRFLWIADSPVISISAERGNSRFPEYPRFDDHCSVTLTTAAGSKAIIQSSWLLPEGDDVHSRSLSCVVGTNGYYQAHGTGVAHGLEARKDGARDLIVTGDAPPRAFDPGDGPGRTAPDDFIAAIRGEAEPYVSPEFYLEVMRIALLGREAAERGETIRVPA